MNPERARQLRDAIRHRSHRDQKLARRYGTDKKRRLYFDNLHPEQTEQVRQLLDGIEGLTVTTTSGRCLVVRYNLTEYTLAGLEKALASQGFRLQDTLLHRWFRALIHFWEDTQLRNLRLPERLLKKSNEVYVKAWEHHPHGDHDETPVELREER
ncbi:MAG: hypothetical protein KBD39_05385 [Sterolibacterium sp.]|jgi:hypothetical protein|nr:hypothetical protein [Sterolibacterium sp.]MBP9799534.1 hypothetical protein [Sterolibacterium sp.]